MKTVLAIGLTMIVVPFALGLPGKAANGEELRDAFAPLMAELELYQADEVDDYLTNEFPLLMQIVRSLRQSVQDFIENTDILEDVPQWLDDYVMLIATIEDMRANYESIANMPDFRLLTLAIVVPGLVLVLLALIDLFVIEPPRHDTADADGESCIGRPL